MSQRRDELIKSLPYARRYARALSGSQPAGDRLVADSLRELMQQEDPAQDRAQLRAALYKAVTTAFRQSLSSGTATLAYADGALGLDQRILLLLTSLEDLSTDQAAAAVGLPRHQAASLLAEARDHLRSAAAADVLIIEDEPIIAMDIEELVQGCGHNVVGVASSEAEALQIASVTMPGLILADINLGLGGDGAAAVARIVAHHRVPVIFVTAYPERLLTGEGVEPAFVITKPFEPMALAIATYQAVTGGVTLA